MTTNIIKNNNKIDVQTNGLFYNNKYSKKDNIRDNYTNLRNNVLIINSFCLN